mgnify:CR=1 FL=1
MFLLRKSYLGVGMFMGMVAGAAAVTAAVLSCPQGRCMARRAVKRGKRVMQHMKPMLDR